MTYKKRMALQRDNVSLRLDVVGGEPLEPAGENVLRMPLVDGVPGERHKRELEFLWLVARGVMTPEQAQTLEVEKDQTHYVVRFHEGSRVYALHIPWPAFAVMQVEEVRRHVEAWVAETAHGQEG